jgi:hypothetical protein
MVEVVETLEAKLKRHEDALVACMAEITKLRDENGRLRATANATAGAHDVLRELYLDPDTPPALRAKCAIGALPHEVPRLMPVPPAIDATAEEIIPLADLVRRRRARQDALEGLPPDHPRILEWIDRDASDFTDSAGNSSAGNGQDDDTAG